MNYIIYPTKESVVLPKRGYFTKGDSGTSILIISSFLATNFIAFEYKTKVKIDDMLGDYFGDNLLAWVKEFQRINNLEVDGNIGPLTLHKLHEYGM